MNDYVRRFDRRRGEAAHIVPPGVRMVGDVSMASRVISESAETPTFHRDIADGNEHGDSAEPEPVAPAAGRGSAPKKKVPEVAAGETGTEEVQS